MGNLFKPEKRAIDSRRRRRTFRFIKKIQRISAVVLIWMAGAAALYGIYMVAFTKPYFQIRKIEVKGDLRALTGEGIIAESGIRVGDQLLRVPVGRIQERLTKNPWVKEAAVHRKPPSLVWIYIKEYLPEAILKGDGWYYVDRFGEKFKRIEPGDDLDFPLITGLDEIATVPEDISSKVVELLRVKRFFETSQLGETYGISEIHYSENRGVSIVTLNDPMELRLGFGPFEEKMARLDAVYPAIRSHGGVVAYVDLNPEGKVVVKYGT